MVYQHLELFSGTGSWGKVFKKHGFNITSVDIVKKFKPTILGDILELDYKTLFPIPDILTASPPCNSYSRLAVSGKTRDWFSLEPLHPNAVLGDKLLNRTLEIIKYFLIKNPKMLFVVENPHGMMWRMPVINSFPRELTEYCLYGFEYRKPTDFFHNFPHGLNLKNPERTKCHKELINTTKVPLEKRYRIPKGIVESVYKSFIHQYGEKPLKVSFEKTRKITLNKNETGKERKEYLEEVADRNPPTNL